MLRIRSAPPGTPPATAPPDRSSPVRVINAEPWCSEGRGCRWAVLGLVLFCTILFFYGVSAGDLWRTENLRARIAAEMLASGNWLVPTLYGQPHLTKPPGMYAAIALASWPFGAVFEWTARLPAALAASITVLLVYWAFRRYLGSQAGLIVAALLPINVLWLDKATAAEIDMPQTAWITGAIVFFLRALDCEEEGPRSRAWLWWLAALTCVAGGVLTKWTAPAFFYGTTIPLLWWRGRLRLLTSWGHLLALATAASICLAWATAAAAQVGWATLIATAGREGLIRLLPGTYGLAYPWAATAAHPLYLFAIGLPFSILALLASRPAFGHLWAGPAHRLWQTLICWAWPNVLVWSLLSDHAARHRLPLFPAINGLAALVWIAWLRGRLAWPFPRLGARQVLVGLLLSWLVVKLVFVHVFLPARNNDRRPRAKGEELAARVPVGRTLYVLPMADRDEGIMFYYRRPVRKLPALEALPRRGGPHFCLVDEDSWRHWHPPAPATVVWRVEGELRGAMVLLKVPAAEAIAQSCAGLTAPPGSIICQAR